MKEVFEFVFPGMMLMWTCFIANGVFVDIFEEYRSNAMARLISSGVSLEQIILAKILRCLVICWACELLLILFTGLVFGVGWKNPLLLFTILTSFNLLVLGFLALVYGYARSSELANGIVVFVFLLSSMLGGSFVPFNELPKALQGIGRWTLIRMGNYGMESIFQSRPVWEVLRPSLLLTVTGLVLMGLGAWVLRRRFETGRIK